MWISFADTFFYWLDLPQGVELAFHQQDVMRIIEPRDPDGFYKVYLRH